MKNMKKILCSLFLGVFMIGAAGCSLIEKTPEAINNTVLAKVGDVKITRAQLNESMADVITELKNTYGETYTSNTEAMTTFKTQATTYLEQLVTGEVLLQKAKALNLVPDLTKMDEEVNKELESVKNEYFEGDQAKLEAGLTEYGYTLDTFKEQIKDQLTNQTDKVSQNRAYYYIIKDVTVTDEDIQTYYDANKEDSFTTKPGAVLSHILVDTEELAKEVRQKIEQGASFEELAAQYNTDSTKETGGSLGYYAYDSQDLVAEFMDAAKVLKEGEISQPVKTTYGYHIIKATGVNAEGRVQPLEEVKEDIRATVLQEKQQTAFDTTLETWKKDLKVKTYEDRIE